MKNSLSFSPLALAVAGVLVSGVAVAETTDLGTLTVTADRQGAKVKTDVVTMAKKDERTETDLRGLFKEEPAIGFGGGNGTSQWVTIRGMGQNQINMVVDGASVDSQIFHHQSRFLINPSLMKVVAIQKGAGAASAGIGVNNGQIVAKTVDVQDLLKGDRNWGFKLNGGYSSNKEHSYGAMAFAKAGQFDFLLGGHWIDQDNYKDGNGNTVANSALDQSAFLAKVGYNLNDDHRFTLSHHKEQTEGMRVIQEEFGFNTTNNNKVPRHREISSTQTTLEWKGQNMGFISRADANISKLENARFEIDTTGPYGGTTSIDSTIANLNLDSDLNDNSLLKYGVNYRKQESFGTKSSSKATQEKIDTGVYVESINRIGDFTVTGGLRYDHFDFTDVFGTSRSDGDINPSLGVIWDATPNFSLNASHNYATRSPRFNDAMFDETEARRLRKIDPNVKADRTANTEVGFNYALSNFNLNGSYFWATTKNLGGGGTVNGVRSITNLGKLKNEGYEINGSYRFDNLKVRAGVAHNETDYYNLNGVKTISDDISQAVPIGRTWTAGVAYRFAQPNIEVGYDVRKVEDASYTNASGTRVARDGYTVHDIYANYKPFNNDKLNVNFGINNLTDEFYRPHSRRGSDFALPGNGREFRVGFNYTY